ncbi:hypothetical protein BDQ12DRAFT_679206 [Crucibulum laeve]|uniref:Uncharacterized protein n=1 Tax=Crucibulum laeve TaxID=68775 RepID=A0A5C3M9Z5_9AGAR|nr:hypothetical protein BDQ12DRAFT_679206 [Crucibulum laeve]
MPEQSTTGGSPVSRSKPTTRSSIRQSLNLASVGKAFADVIGKESWDSSKNAKKAKDSSRRLSAVNLKPAAPRASMGDVKPPLQNAKRAATPESKTITRRRVSASIQRSSSDEQAKRSDSATPQGASIPRSASLRPKTNASALPKYRPKSVALDPPKSPSPVRAGTRRRLSSSDDDSESKKEQTKPGPSLSPAEKVTRPISPLPQRAALKANMAAVNTTPPPSTPSRTKVATPSSIKASPIRPTKAVKTATVSLAAQSAIPRPPSSTSSSSSFTPHTPKTPGVRNGAGLRRAVQDKGKLRTTPTPSNASPHSSIRDSPSPLSRHSRKGSKAESSGLTVSDVGNMSHISEGNSEDSETEDVELLLAPVAALGAPTPAMPRIQRRRGEAPQTPTRNMNLLPTRANMSYVSPLPPDKDSSSSLRPHVRPNSSKAARGSILSWEQLATDASRTLGEDEIEHMLSDIPAPFPSGAASPTLSTLEVPESPCLSTLDSPGGYGSISQVLLPDVTPSPAVHHSARYSLSPQGTPADAATMTLLRLQMAQIENTAKERLYQIQAMEEEIHNLKEVHMRQMQEAEKQMVYMESQGRSEAEREAYTTSLEDRLQQIQVRHDQAIEDAVTRSEEKNRASRDAVMKRERTICETACSARLAQSEWASVREISEIELDAIRGDRDTLSVLLAELDQMCRTIS